MSNTRNISQPALWLGYNTLAFLKQRGISVTEGVKKGTCSGPCKILAKWESKPLDFHFYNMMKYSSNFVTRMLVSHIPILKGAKKGDLNRGLSWVQSYLKDTQGIKNFSLREPSGLDRKNKFQAKDLLKILTNSRQYFYRSRNALLLPFGRRKRHFRKTISKPPALCFCSC